MSNMSYVRFENTVRDLADCVEHLDDQLSESEARARARLLQLCVQVVQECGLSVAAEVQP